MDEGALSSIMTEAMVDTHSLEEPAFDKVPVLHNKLNSTESISICSSLITKLFIKPLSLTGISQSGKREVVLCPPFCSKFESSLSFVCKLACTLKLNSRRERSLSF